MLHRNNGCHKYAGKHEKDEPFHGSIQNEWGINPPEETGDPPGP